MPETLEFLQTDFSQGWSTSVTRLFSGIGTKTKRETDLIVGRVLHPLRNSLSFRDSGELIALLPDYFKFIYISDWRMKETQKPIHHLDELIMRIKDFDDQKEPSLFGNEMDILKAVVAVFSTLDPFVQWEDQDYLDSRLTSEIKRAME
jgi:uncharacterized protein (DUF2267 family)